MNKNTATSGKLIIANYMLCKIIFVYPVQVGQVG
jgi:hypothetical protein